MYFFVRTEVKAIQTVKMLTFLIARFEERQGCSQQSRLVTIKFLRRVVASQVSTLHIFFGLCQSCHDEKLDMNQV